MQGYGVRRLQHCTIASIIHSCHWFMADIGYKIPRRNKSYSAILCIFPLQAIRNYWTLPYLTLQRSEAWIPKLYSRVVYERHPARQSQGQTDRQTVRMSTRIRLYAMRA